MLRRRIVFRYLNVQLYRGIIGNFATSRSKYVGADVSGNIGISFRFFICCFGSTSTLFNQGWFYMDLRRDFKGFAICFKVVIFVRGVVNLFSRYTWYVVRQVSFFDDVECFVSFFRYLRSFIYKEGLVRFHSRFTGFMGNLLVVCNVPTFTRSFPSDVRNFLMNIDAHLASMDRGLFLLFLFHVGCFRLGRSFIRASDVLPMVN